HTLLLPSILPPPPRSPLFPYTTLFRSPGVRGVGRDELEAERAHAPLAALRQRVELRAGDPERRMRLLVRLRQHVAERHVEILARSEEHTSELQSLRHLVCRLLLEKKKN